jgi:hypothetical protein
LNIHLPHEIVGILVAQALDWDTQRIAEAFTVALKQANEQGLVTRASASGEDYDRTEDSAGNPPESASSPAAQGQSARDHDSVPVVDSTAPGNSPLRPDGKSHATDQLSNAGAGDAPSSLSVAEVRQQFITLGELVLEAIGAVDINGREAVG